MPDFLIRFLENDDLQPMAAAFAQLGWNKPVSQYQKYLSEQEAGARVVLVAFFNGEFAGYVTIVWRSLTPAFAISQFPELVDFNVLPKFRRQGIGAALLDEAERRVAEVSPVVGLGVGLTADYGAAQRLYVKRGYVPDGRGLFSAGQPVAYGQSVPVDDDLVLFWTKKLR